MGIEHPVTSGHSDAQPARMSKITNDGLSRSVTGCSIPIVVPTWQHWASKG